MNGSLQTEEFERKKNYKVFIVIFITIIIISLIVFSIYKYSEYAKEKKKKEKEKVIVNPLNEELIDIYGFAISDNYIVALKNNGTYVKIYNLLQGTGNFGDFTAYNYYDKKLYLLYSDNVLYTISLDKGNRVYELVKFYDLEPVPCQNGTIGKTSDIAFNNNSIYLNNSNCSLVRLKIDKKTNKISHEVLKNFTSLNVNMEYNKSIKSLFVYGDNNIFKIDNNTQQLTTITNNITSSENMLLKSNVLVYETIENNIKTYYGYNIKTNVNSKIVEADKLLVYNNSFIYLKNNKIYKLLNNKEYEIYTPHYNVLSDMELIGQDTLQVVDTSIDEDKKRIVNINLKSKKKDITYNDVLFNNVIEYFK